MTHDNTNGSSTIPDGKRAQLTDSINTLIREYGQTSNPYTATAINVLTILIGVGVWHYTTGLASYAGAILAIWTALSVLKWVVQA